MPSQARSRSVRGATAYWVLAHRHCASVPSGQEGTCAQLKFVLVSTKKKKKNQGKAQSKPINQHPPDDLTVMYIPPAVTVHLFFSSVEANGKYSKRAKLRLCRKADAEQILNLHKINSITIAVLLPYKTQNTSPFLGSVSFAVNHKVNRLHGMSPGIKPRLTPLPPRAFVFINPLYAFRMSLIFNRWMQVSSLFPSPL